jgi:hypothetical protein
MSKAWARLRASVADRRRAAAARDRAVASYFSVAGPR